MSFFQLNEGKVFWDPYKHKRNKSEQPYYRWYVHANAVNNKLPPNPMVHVQRPIMHGEWFDKRWFPCSGFETRGTKDTVIYHPKYNGPKISVLSYKQPPEPIDEGSIFRPPEEKEWIEAFSEKKTPRKEKKKNKANNEQTDPNPFDLSQMKPYHDNIRISTTTKEYTPRNDAKWGKLQSEPQPTINKWQQGHMSKEEVAGEPTTPGVANPKFKIPKLSERKELVSDKLNQLAASISPPAKERKKDTSSTTQPHKNKKGRHRQFGQQGGTRKSRGGRRK